jgi:hypothetical protein
MVLNEHRVHTRLRLGRLTELIVSYLWSMANSDVPHPLRYRVLLNMCSGITSTKSPSFGMTTFSTSLANLTVLLAQSHDCSCHVSRRILALL